MKRRNHTRSTADYLVEEVVSPPAENEVLWFEVNPEPEPEPENKPDPKMGIVYYTDNRLDGTPLNEAVKEQLRRSGLPIVAVSLQPICDLGENPCLNLLQPGFVTMFKEILTGLEISRADYVFLAEHDVLYHSSHFRFVPPDAEHYWYNTHTYKIRASDGLALSYAGLLVSGLCASRELLVRHYRERLRLIEEHTTYLVASKLPVRREGYEWSMGFEPGRHSLPRGVDNIPALTWRSEYPNLDVRHGKNLTTADVFMHKSLVSDVPGWGHIAGRYAEFIAGLVPPVEPAPILLDERAIPDLD